jgi:type II secretory pathway component GspD/PulD (secretin)
VPRSQVRVQFAAALIVAASAPAVALQSERAEVRPSAAAPAAEQQEAKPARARDIVFFERDITLGELLFLCADEVGVTIEFDPAKLGGPVKPRPGARYSAERAWQLAQQELAAAGLATVQPPGSRTLRVVPLAEAASAARIESYDLVDAKAGFVRVLVPLERRKAEDLVETVKLVLSKPGGAVNAVRDGNSLLIADLRPHVEQARTMLALLELPSASPAIEEIALEHLAPVAMSALIERVVNARKAVGGEALRGSVLGIAEARTMLVVAPAAEIGWWRETIRSFDRPEPTSTLHYTPRRFGLDDTARLVEQVVRGGAGDASAPWKLVVDRLTGTLILTTNSAGHTKVQELFERLESEAWAPREPLRAFAIKRRRVSEMLTVLESLIDAGVLETQSPAQPATPAVQGATGPVASSSAAGSGSRAVNETKGKITLAADEATSRILAFGEGSALDQLGSLIESLDVRPPQVLVEATVVSLSDTQTRQFGVELQKLGTAGTASLRLSSLFGLGSPDPSLGVIAPGTASGASAIVLDPGDFSAVVRALESVNQGRSLTTPKVLVDNNAKAALDSLLQTPYVSTNASTTVATTSFGGTLDAGTRVSVKPQVADSGQIMLEYTVSLSSFVGESPGEGLPPPRQENKLESMVTIPDGFTVVLGGLEIETKGNVEERVPWLGEIPLVGLLFKDRSRTTTRSRFYVFLRCSVWRDELFEGLKYASARELSAAGVDDGTPVLRPRVMR